jgi:hypothetical protein
MYSKMNQSTKSIVSQVMKGAIARIVLEDSTAVYNKTILVLNNKITLVEECRSLETDEHLKRPTTKVISKSEALSLCDKYRVETIIDIVDDETKEDHLDSAIEIKEGVYEY